MKQTPQLHSRRASLRDSAQNSLQERGSQRNSIRDLRRGSLHDTKLDSVSVRESDRSLTREVRRGSLIRGISSVQRPLRPLQEVVKLKNTTMFAFSSGGLNGPSGNCPPSSGLGSSIKRIRSATNTQAECSFSPRYNLLIFF